MSPRNIPTRLIPVCVLTAVALALASCKGGHTEQQQGGPVQVTVVTLKPQPVTVTRELPGRTSAYLIAEVRPQVNGVIKQRLFTEGAMVKAGQPLYQLDDAVYRADNNNARASLAKAKATLYSAQLNARRTTELARIDAVSKQDDESATATWRQAEADVAAAQATVESTGVTLAFARIVSPISGRIGKSSVTQGALVTANQADPMARVQQLDPIFVDVTQSSGELLQLRKQLAAGTLKESNGTPVKILLEDGSRYPLDGKLEFADVSVDPTTGSFALRVIVPNPEHALLPGMYVRAVLDKGTNAQALLVPQAGILRDPKGGATAFVVDKDGKAALRDVQATRTIGDQWLVESGLSAGDKVIVEGLQMVQPGAAVHATEAGTAPVAAAQTAKAPH
ncbi:membrane fusion protein (multidrug efflux system) [Luteibacter rhizovicinus]|uniref:Membrane fusion protein (Multidrug efflux system) n=1 Tax=Luteibacter rhizovicinus TaxID=242606 RepID=A0A4V2W4Z6_9GAMM|nr:efflux RND transporter periplasmic adaptor subunit [Luteibacter rhizovicinus]TCV97789.1 membrane fusion protein (multidrug efflux system) [Luteibacter rhizovicinus]